MTIQEIQEEIIKEFKDFNDPMDKYNYLIKLGKDLPPIDSKYKTIKLAKQKITVSDAEVKAALSDIENKFTKFEETKVKTAKAKL